MKGISIGGLGIGASGQVSGISFGGLGIGAGEDLKGLSIGGLGVGSGKSVSGITVGGLGIGAGNEIKGLAVAIIGVGSPRIRGIVIAGAAGGNNINGLFIVPGYLQVGSRETADLEVIMNGVSVSAFNHIRGVQKGMTIGIFNYANTQKGFQLGLLNYVKDNPKGLRLLPVFNMHFGKSD